MQIVSNRDNVSFLQTRLCQNLFSENNKTKKNIISMSSAENFTQMLSVIN